MPRPSQSLVRALAALRPLATHEAARQLGCDESEERFVETVRKLATTPPAPHKKGTKPEKKQPAK
jgi:hypothetical protein